MAEKIFIADKTTQDLIKQKTDLIGSPNPTIADTNTLMNYLKKLEGAIGQNSGGYVPKLAGGIGMGYTGLAFPYNEQYAIYYQKDSSEYIGLLDKTKATNSVTTYSYPYTGRTSRWTFNFDKGYAYHTYDGGVATVNLVNNTRTTKAVTGCTARGSLAFPTADGNVMVIHSETQAWHLYSADMTTLLKTINVDVAVGMNSMSATIAFDPKSNTAYFAYSSNIMSMSVKSYNIDTTAGTATQFINKSFTFQAGGSASATSVGVYFTEDYVMFFQFGSTQYVIFDRTDSTNTYGGTFWYTSTGGWFDGDTNGGTYLAGLQMTNMGKAAFMFISLGNNKFLALRYKGTEAEEQSGVVAQIVGGKLVPLKKIYARNLPEIEYTLSSASHEPNMLLTNYQHQNGHIVVNSTEYDISDLLE